MRYVASKISNEPYKVNSFWVIFTQNLGMRVYRLAAGERIPLSARKQLLPSFPLPSPASTPQWSGRPGPLHVLGGAHGLLPVDTILLNVYITLHR